MTADILERLWQQDKAFAEWHCEVYKHPSPEAGFWISVYYGIAHEFYKANA